MEPTKFTPDEAKDFQKSEVEPSENPLVTAYRLVHQREPDAGLGLIDLAEQLIEVLDNPNWIPNDLALKCGDEILKLRNLKNPEYDSRAKSVILAFENGVAQNILPNLKKTNEMHMDDWEVARLESEEK